MLARADAAEATVVGAATLSKGASDDGAEGTEGADDSGSEVEEEEEEDEEATTAPLASAAAMEALLRERPPDGVRTRAGGRRVRAQVGDLTFDRASFSATEQGDLTCAPCRGAEKRIYATKAVMLEMPQTEMQSLRCVH
jgi:hypothetical protein